MPEPLLNVMKIMLLAGLYLFFVRVLWSVYNELRDPRTRVTARPSPGEAAGRTTVRAPADAPARSRAAAPAAAVMAPPAPPALLVGQLVMLEPLDRAGTTWALGNEVTIGRDPSCGVQLDDTYVSSIHARVFNTKGVFHVEDLDSRNGTLLDDQPLEPARATRLDPGARIRIGATVLEFS